MKARALHMLRVARWLLEAARLAIVGAESVVDAAIALLDQRPHRPEGI